MPPIQIFVYSTFEIIGAGLKTLIAEMSGYSIAGDAANIAELKERLRIGTYDIVLVAALYFDADCEISLCAILENAPNTKILMLFFDVNPRFIEIANLLCVRGVMRLSATTLELMVAMRAVQNGQSYYCPEIVKRVVNDYRQRNDNWSSALDNGLSKRQKEFLTLISEGKSTFQVAEQKNVSLKTVERQCYILLKKTKNFDLASLIRYSIERVTTLPSHRPVVKAQKKEASGKEKAEGRG